MAGEPGALEVSNNFGTWRASTVERPLGSDDLWVKLPVDSNVGDKLTNSSWSRPASLPLFDPSAVLDTYRGALRLEEPAVDGVGLRSPQLGAIHAVLGYWTTKRSEPATVVMPTGTGKTETMLGLLVAARPDRLLAAMKNCP